jgi:DNA (cytosine-5)-methyltransferase 1
MRNGLTVVSLFSGLGGLDFGFELEDYTILCALDSSIAATKTYEVNFGRPAICKDITQLSSNDIPDSEIIIGGPPCQAFSLMGQRKPDDPRGKLVFHFLDVVKQKKPLAFVMENVPGMSASKIDGIRLPDLLTHEFEQLGYSVGKFELLATDYLVPQRRKRLIMVGSRVHQPARPDPVQFARSRYDVDLFSYDVSSRAAIGDLGKCSMKGSRSPYSPHGQSPFARIMRSAALPDVSLHECPRMSRTDSLIVSHIPPGGNYTDIPDEIAPGRVLKYKKTGGRTTTYGRLHPDEPAFTINTYFRRPNVGCNFHYSEPRLITPREAMRFQSIPDHFELKYSSQDERNALIGNAVPPLMARAIAWNLKIELTSRSNTTRHSRSEQISLLDA